MDAEVSSTRSAVEFAQRPTGPLVLDLVVPYERGDVLAAVHREGEVLMESHGEGATRLRVRVDAPGAARFADFVAEPA